MEIEARLRKLESLYRSALSAAVTSKARYLALDAEAGATPTAIARARAEWHVLERRKRALAREMGELEKLEHESAT